MFHASLATGLLLIGVDAGVESWAPSDSRHFVLMFLVFSGHGACILMFQCSIATKTFFDGAAVL